MTKKPKRPPDDPEQYARFREAAANAEASDDPQALERAIAAVTAKPSSSSPASSGAQTRKPKGLKQAKP
jgi:hypothetical protein